MSTGQVVWCLAVLTFAAFVQSVGGFGFALMAVPLSAIVIDLTTAVIAVSIASVINVTLLLWRTYTDIDRGLAWRFNLPSLFGMPLGIAVLVYVPQRELKVVLGVVIIVATLLLMRGVRRVTPRKWVEVLAGWISGVLATSTGTNGPPLVMAAQMRGLDADTFRATLSFTFVVSGPISLVFFAVAGRMSQAAIALALGSIPLIVLGQQLGLRVRPRVHGTTFERLVYVLLLLSGISVAGSGFFS
jgi:uncharacterized membrane protein YfcA